MSRVMNDGYTRKSYVEVLQMDAYELRQDLAYRLAYWRGTSRAENERFHSDLARLAKLAGMTVEALLTELHQDAELID